jgi:proteasome lid subunit RPN8/RPN11
MQEVQDQGELEVWLGLAAQRVLLSDVQVRRRIEACGLLLGHQDRRGNWYAGEACPLQNRAESPVYFEFAPEEVLAVELARPGAVIGVYHSHPAGPRAASRIDRETMRRVNVEQAIPWVWLILCGPFGPLDRYEEWGALAVADFLGEHLLAYYHDPTGGLQRVQVRLCLGEKECCG